MKKDEFIELKTDILTKIKWNKDFGIFIFFKKSGDTYTVIDIVERQNDFDTHYWTNRHVGDVLKSFTLEQLRTKLEKKYKNQYQKYVEKQQAEVKRKKMIDIKAINEKLPFQEFCDKHNLYLEKRQYGDLAFDIKNKAIRNAYCLIEKCHIIKYDYYYWHINLSTGLFTKEVYFERIEDIIEWLEEFGVYFLTMNMYDRSNSHHAMGSNQMLPSYMKVRREYENKHKK